MMVFQFPWTRVRKVLSVWNQLGKHEILELSRPGVNIKDRVHVDQLIQALQSAGTHTLQVISDFDMTLSKFAHNGQRCATTHSLLHNRGLISEDCKSKEVLSCGE
ncbi:7-methylguanosine phosphate-specific 5'-nucleotidase-like [Alosa sapidissima]|uniref:7-methylguanosine phosphate-specific 5'-nucleotidase-like n=1 Tax=Alosa sapidissima TaxID=34773 RepID=UPI001C09A272|nr:7-methylguanosine phosphate-specific 5'-nucleotidase-like [Alosa sapidissima]